MMDIYFSSGGLHSSVFVHSGYPACLAVLPGSLSLLYPFLKFVFENVHIFLFLLFYWQFFTF
jgi:hypothetical protein